MKTLLNASDKHEIVQRLTHLEADSPRMWGRMSAHQMICHLGDGFRMYMGQKKVEPVGGIYPSRVMRWIALWAPLQWPKGFKTMRELEQRGGGGTAPIDFVRDKQELNALLERFTRTPRDYTFATHPHFGDMTEGEWMRLAYLHADHHLRQFSC